MKSTKSKMRASMQKEEAKDISQVEVEVPLNTDGEMQVAENPKVDVENVD